MPVATRKLVDGYLDVTRTAQLGSRNGVALETASGTLLVATMSPFTILRSTDGGGTWSTRYTESHPNSNARLNFTDSNGNVYLGKYVSGSTTKTEILRSTDDGLNWTSVLAPTSDSVWYMIERSNGDLYLNEYNQSAGDVSTFAYNIWKSTDNGVNWSVFYTHPPGNDPSVQPDRTIRHIHLLGVDSNDQMYISMAHGNDVGTYYLNDDATISEDIGDTYLGAQTSLGGGMTAMVVADNGDVLFGPDNVPTDIYKHNSSMLAMESVYSIVDRHGSQCDTFVLGMAKGRDGVLYAVTNGDTTYASVLLASYDDGATWVLIEFNNRQRRVTFVTVGKGPIPYIYLNGSSGGDGYVRLPDWTRKQLESLVIHA